jgi:transposase
LSRTLGSKLNQTIDRIGRALFKLANSEARVIASELWFRDRQQAVITPLLPTAGRVDDRRILSGIVHLLRSGCRWQNCPSPYGPATTIYNRFHRWARRGLWQRLLHALIQAKPDDMHLLDSTIAKAHRSAAGAPRR